MSETVETTPYERTETFVFRFTDKKEWEAFFEKYYRGEGKPAGILALSCLHGNAMKEKEDAETLFCEFMEEFKLTDLGLFQGGTEKQQKILDRMEKFLQGCPY